MRLLSGGGYRGSKASTIDTRIKRTDCGISRLFKIDFRPLFVLIANKILQTPHKSTQRNSLVIPSDHKRLNPATAPLRLPSRPLTNMCLGFGYQISYTRECLELVEWPSRKQYVGFDFTIHFDFIIYLCRVSRKLPHR